MSLKEQLKEYAQKRPHEWISGNELEQFTITTGHKASYGARECRRLAEEGSFEREETARGYVQYRYRRVMDQVKKDEKVLERQPAMI